MAGPGSPWPLPGAAPSLFRDHKRGEVVIDDDAGAVMRGRQHVGVDPEGKGRVAVAEVFGEFLDGDAELGDGTGSAQSN